MDFRRGIRNLLRVLHLSEAGNGDTKPCRRSPSPVLEDNRDIDGMLETFRGLIAQLSHDGMEIGDICARAEQKAARYALLSETVIEAASSGILVVDESDRVLLANSSAKRILDIRPQTEVTGMDLAALFKDGREFRYLVRKCMETGINASRKIREVVTLTGKRLRLGVSTSCVGPVPSSVEAVIMIFASLEAEWNPLSKPGAEPGRALEKNTYLRGVLDSYDLVSGLVADFQRIEEKSNSGTLTTSELWDFSRSMRRTCDIMLAFALSLGVEDSIPELVDINGVLESVVARLGLNGESRLKKHFSEGLPSVKTIRKMLEVGLGLLIRGCLNRSSEGIEIAARPADGGRPPSVIIDVRELSPSGPIAAIKGSLRELTGDEDMEREAGLFLLSKLPKECHNVQVKHVDGFFHFSMIVGSPIEEETGRGKRQGGDFGTGKG